MGYLDSGCAAFNKGRRLAGTNLPFSNSKKSTLSGFMIYISIGQSSGMQQHISVTSLNIVSNLLPLLEFSGEKHL